ncbi:hypothetical protein MTO96_027435 [Rhipicephalus appendiculatus]
MAHPVTKIEPDDRKGLGFPCARDTDCLTGRGQSCQEWVCACAPSSPVKVQVQGIDACLPAKALYESCRYHEECSHRSSNMRCVDFLCYCPLPFELRGNGDCLARSFPATIRKPPLTSLIGNQIRSACPLRIPQGGKVPTTSICVRSGPLKSLRPKKPNSSTSNKRTSAPSPSFPSTRLLRVPPDQLRPGGFSPGPTSKTTAMRTCSFTPPVPFAKSSQMLDKSSARSTAQPQPSRLSTTRLMNKILSSSADSSDEDNIVVRVFEDYTTTSQSKSPQKTSLPFMATDMQQREVLPFRNRDCCPVGDDSSLPIEWGTSSDRDRQGSLATGGKQGVTKEGLEEDDPLGKTLFSSFHQSKNVTFLDDVSSVSGADRSHLDEGKTPGQLTAKRSTIFAGTRPYYED